MVKRGVSLALVIVLCVLVSAGAWARYTDADEVKPKLSISGTTATCGVTVTGKTGTTKITGTATLYRIESGVASAVKTWSGLSTTSDTLKFSDTWSVTRGYTYRLTISATVYRNGGSEAVSESVSAYAS